MSGFFDWFKPKKTQERFHPLKREPARPQEVDLTDGKQSNIALTKGLYHNSYPGLKLAGSMARIPIVIPIWFMGLPIINGIETDLIERFQKQIRQIHLQSHRDGTAWVWPHYSSKLKKVIWEFIADDTITDIVRDIDTLEPVKIITDEYLTITTGYNLTVRVRRERTFEKGKVTVRWLDGKNALPTQLTDYAIKNIAEELPIAFANNVDGDEIRGHSDYEPILPDLKAYHDIELKANELLAKFTPKWVQSVSNVEEWLENNCFDDFNSIDVAGADFIINQYEKEKTEFVFPERAYEAYSQAKKDIYRKIVEGSLMPELLWGPKVSGNLGSYESQIDSLVKFVQDKRNQKTEPYKKLFDATIRLESIATMSGSVPLYKIEWDALDAVSESTKATILKDFSQGVNYLINCAGATPEMIQKLWEKTYPGITPDNPEEFISGLTAMAKHKSFTNADFELIQDSENDLV